MSKDIPYTGESESDRQGTLTIQKMERKCGKDRIMNEDNGLDLSKAWLDLAITP